MTKLSADYPMFEKGITLDVMGLPLVNGSTVEIEEADEASFKARHGKTVRQALASNPHVKVEGTKKEGGE